MANTRKYSTVIEVEIIHIGWNDAQMKLPVQESIGQITEIIRVRNPFPVDGRKKPID